MYTKPSSAMVRLGKVGNARGLGELEFLSYSFSLLG